MSAYEFWGGLNSAYNTGERGIKREKQTDRKERGTDSFGEHVWDSLQVAEGGRRLFSFQRERRGRADGRYKGSLCSITAVGSFLMLPGADLSVSGKTVILMSMTEKSGPKQEPVTHLRS